MSTNRTHLKYEIQAFGQTVDIPKGSQQIAEKEMDSFRTCKLFRYNADGSKVCIKEKVAKLRDPEVRHANRTILKGLYAESQKQLARKSRKRAGTKRNHLGRSKRKISTRA